jgi:RecA-family ATPase
VTLADMSDLILRSLAGKDALLAVAAPSKGDVMQETPLFAALDSWLAEHRPVLTVLDTLADLFGGNEINRAQARQFIGMLRGLALRHETTVLLLAHPSLNGISSGSGSSGSTAWNNSVRSRIYLRRVTTPEGDEADTDARELEVKKANYGKTGLILPLRWQAGVFVAEVKAEGILDRLAASAKVERVFLKILKAYTDEGRYVSAQPGPTFAPSAFAAHPGAEGCHKRALRAAMDSLLGKGKICIASHGTGVKARSHLAEVQPDGE